MFVLACMLVFNMKLTVSSLIFDVVNLCSIDPSNLWQAIFNQSGTVVQDVPNDLEKLTFNFTFDLYAIVAQPTSKNGSGYTFDAANLKFEAMLVLVVCLLMKIIHLEMKIYDLQK